MAKSLILCRSDAGDGGWSLHPPDTTDNAIATGVARILASSDAERTDDGWSRPDDADYMSAWYAMGPNSAGSISVDVIYGSRSASDVDLDRARMAAATVLNRHGIRADDAYSDYQVQCAEYEDDMDKLTGAASAWREADVAADIALTAGWADPCGASCSISA